MNINKHKLFRYSKFDAKARNLWKWTEENSHPTVNYDLFGSKTGRLTTKMGSVPIMNLKTEIKDIVEPKWDCFVEFDFNAAEIRAMISLMGQKQPQEDIHEWNIKNIFSHGSTIRKTKLSILNTIAKTLSSKNFSTNKKKYYEPPLVEGQIAIDFTPSTTSFNPVPPITVWTGSTKSKGS